MLSRDSPKQILRYAWLGNVGYQSAYELQLRLLEARSRDEIPDTLLLLEHPHVFTLGRRGVQDDVLADEADLKSLDVEVIETDRGGQTTYHGPGQLVAYPILNLRALHIGPVAYVRALEDVVMNLLTGLDVEAHRVDGATGVWTHGSLRPDLAPPLENAAKIAAIGVRISRGISMHGVAINLSTDLTYFGKIVPCGMPDVQMASVESISGKAPNIEDIAAKLAESLARVLGSELEGISPDAVAA
ncbi:MAG: lipoyl(octanoyl) transferase LipB [Chloroflexi bacterium]|nr:lipoyl(octanoyl) transferase LipB [Chloroflexota bacterium]